ncbi:hypothetical protein ZWY2020_025388 [Hordeum vulgare]|nr:hypothetical protein ZWY2020_025388 [Hordeum vulgare]
MDQSIAWQKVVQDLAGNNQEIREQLRDDAEPRPWPDQGDARGREALCLPPGYYVPPSVVILWAMREVQRTTDPTQRARWWMYRSSRMTAPQPDPTHLALRTERVTDAVVTLPATVLDPEVRSFHQSSLAETTRIRGSQRSRWWVWCAAQSA